ncbi:MAG: 7-cyano-7-deazaguanine synthase, partial [Defluviitaleaceae bacterium]|nr:7-cyano-7-deazaguanine synthase [Defluviitaleaceae bacterium]
MYKKVLNTILKYDMIQSGDKVLIGFSGGMDSCCLLHFLISQQQSLEIKIGAVHINHGLRGEESQRDEEFCIKICKEYGIKLDIFNYDVGEIAEKRGISTEEAGRIT